MVTRVAMIRKSDDSLCIKSFTAASFDDAHEAALRWVAKKLADGDDIRVLDAEYFLPVAEHFIETHAERADVPVVHSRVLSEQDREFLAGCLISTEGL